MTLVLAGPGPAAQTSGRGDLRTLVREVSDATKAFWDSLDQLNGEPHRTPPMLRSQPGSGDSLGLSLPGPDMQDGDLMDWIDGQPADSAFGGPNFWANLGAAQADLQGLNPDPVLPRWSSDELMVPGTPFFLPDLPAGFPMLEDHLTEAEPTPVWPDHQRATRPAAILRRGRSHRPVRMGRQTRSLSVILDARTGGAVGLSGLTACHRR